jgi:hypothetical protein
MPASGGAERPLRISLEGHSYGGVGSNPAVGGQRIALPPLGVVSIRNDLHRMGGRSEPEGVPDQVGRNPQAPPRPCPPPSRRRYLGRTRPYCQRARPTSRSPRARSLSSSTSSGAKSPTSRRSKAPQERPTEIEEDPFRGSASLCVELGRWPAWACRWPHIPFCSM